MHSHVWIVTLYYECYYYYREGALSIHAKLSWPRISQRRTFPGEAWTPAQKRKLEGTHGHKQKKSYRQTYKLDSNNSFSGPKALGFCEGWELRVVVSQRAYGLSWNSLIQTCACTVRQVSRGPLRTCWRVECQHFSLAVPKFELPFHTERTNSLCSSKNQNSHGLQVNGESWYCLVIIL